MFVTASLYFVIASASGGDVTVQVVDAKRQPVAGAWVAGFVASGVGFREREFDDGGHGIDAIQQWLESGAAGAPSGTSEWSASDAHGRVTLHPASFWSDFVAVTPTLSGHAIFVRGSAAKGDVVPIVVAPHRFWRVQVVDATEPKWRPIVSVEFGTEGDLHERTSFRRITARTTKCDNDPWNLGPSVATLGPIDLFFDPLAIDPTLVARLDLPIDPAPRLRVRASQIDTTEAQLVIPAHGSLDVYVVDPTGKVVKRPGFVALRRDRDPEFHSKNSRIFARSWQNSDLGTWRKATTGGLATFDIVGLDAALELGNEDGEFGPTRNPKNRLNQTGPLGPLTQSGERRVLTVTDADVSRRAAVLHGRLVDAHGKAIARRRLSFDFCQLEMPKGVDAGDPWHDWAEVRTSSDGGFEATLEVMKEFRGPAWLVVTEVDPICDEGAPVAAKFVDIPKVEEWTGAELGDVALETLLLLAGGRAVDEEGEPVAALEVELACDARALTRDPTVSPWWSIANPSPSTVTRSDGRFEVHGFGHELKWRLTASNDEFSGPRGIDIETGQSDLVLHCKRNREPDPKGPTGQLAGSLLLDPDVPRGAVVVCIDVKPTDPGITYTLNGFFGTFPSDRGSCSLSGSSDAVPGDRFGGSEIAAGTWTVTVLLQDFFEEPTLLATVPGVKVEQGKTATLAPIDLRGRIHVKRLEIVDRGGALVAGGFMFKRPPKEPGRDDSSHCGFFHDGESVLCTAADDWPALDFVATGLRLVPRRFYDSPFETVVLPPALRVQAVLPTGLLLPPLPLEIAVRMDTNDPALEANWIGASRRPRGDEVSFGKSGIAELHLPAAARYTLTMSVRHWVPGVHPSTFNSVDLSIRREVTVADGEEPQRVEVEVNQAEVDAAVQRLGL